MKKTLLLLTALLATVGCSHEPAHDPQPTTVDIQGAGEWKRSPQMRAYYDETVKTFSNGTNVDVDAYEARSFAIFREFARANGMNEAGMIDHLKLIPRQVVGIVKENPAVLQSYDAFWAALAGPD
jgi:argininosuccinate synthase